MRQILSTAGALILFLSGLPYIIDIIKGKTHPNLVTWITWTLLNVINAVAAASTGAISTAILAASAGLTTAIIVTMGFKHGVKRYTRFDIICQALALVGIVIWRLTASPDLAIAIALSVELIAAFPTWRHAWVSPHAETWEGFGISIPAGLLTIASLTNFTFVTLAYPIVLVGNCAVIVSIILGRRRQLKLTPQS